MINHFTNINKANIYRPLQIIKTKTAQRHVSMDMTVLTWDKYMRAGYVANTIVVSLVLNRKSKNRKFSGLNKTDKAQTMIHKSLFRNNKDWAAQTSLMFIKTEDELVCSRVVSSSCYTVHKSYFSCYKPGDISHEWRKGMVVITINGTHPWSLWHTYFETVNQTMTASVKRSK